MKNNVKICCLAAAILALGAIVSYASTSMDATGIAKEEHLKENEIMLSGKGEESLDADVSTEVLSDQNPQKQEEAGCFAVTGRASAEILDYARSEFPGFLAEYLASNGVGAYDNTYALGHPLKWQEEGGGNDIYDFPVMQAGNILAVMTICDDGGIYNARLEENLMAHKLNELKERTSLANPLVFLANDAGFFAVLGDNVWPLTPDSDVSGFDASILQDDISAEEVTNLAEILSTVDGNDIGRINEMNEPQEKEDSGDVKRQEPSVTPNEAESLVPADAEEGGREYHVRKNGLFLDFDNFGVKKIVTELKGDGTFLAEDLGTWLKKHDVYDISVVEDKGDCKKLYYKCVPENQDREEYGYSKDTDALRFEWLVEEGDVITDTDACLEVVTMVEPSGSFYTDYKLDSAMEIE